MSQFLVCADCKRVFEAEPMGAFVMLTSSASIIGVPGSGNYMPTGVCPECQEKRRKSYEEKRAENRKLSLLMQQTLECYKDEETEPVSVVYCRHCVYLGFDPDVDWDQPWFYCKRSGDMENVALEDYCAKAIRGAPRFVDEDGDGE